MAVLTVLQQLAEENVRVLLAKVADADVLGGNGEDVPTAGEEEGARA